MKCLRCGKDMDNDIECDCGHFYETNLKNNKTKKNNKRKKKPFTLIELLAVLIILSILLSIVIPFINSDNNKKSDYCEMVCEGSAYTIKESNCICSNGSKYPINK